MEGLREKEAKERKTSWIQTTVWGLREWGGGCERVWGIHGDGRRLDLEDKHTIQDTDDVLYNCVRETCAILLTSATPQNSIKWKNAYKN